MNKLQTFVIWLDGFLDAAGANITPEQTMTIKAKLDKIFDHVAEESKEQQKPKPTLEELGAEHGFHGKTGFPNSLGHDEDGNLMRC